MLPELKFRPSLSAPRKAFHRVVGLRVAGTKVPALIERRTVLSVDSRYALVLPELKFRPSLSDAGRAGMTYHGYGVAGTKVPALIERTEG